MSDYNDPYIVPLSFIDQDQKMKLKQIIKI